MAPGPCWARLSPLGMVRVLAVVAGPTAPVAAETAPLTGYCTDDDGSVHAAAIDAAGRAGLTTGSGPEESGPGMDLRRDEMATFVALATAVGVGGCRAGTPARGSCSRAPNVHGCAPSLRTSSRPSPARSMTPRREPQRLGVTGELDAAVGHGVVEQLAAVTADRTQLLGQVDGHGQLELELGLVATDEGCAELLTQRGRRRRSRGHRRTHRLLVVEPGRVARASRGWVSRMRRVTSSPEAAVIAATAMMAMLSE